MHFVFILGCKPQETHYMYVTILKLENQSGI